MTYLRNWVLVALVIAFRFFLDFHSFLLEVIKMNSSSLLYFQTHLRLVQEFFSFNGNDACPPF
jgi:hypothetical protein